MRITAISVCATVVLWLAASGNSDEPEKKIGTQTAVSKPVFLIEVLRKQGEKKVEVKNKKFLPVRVYLRYYPAQYYFDDNEKRVDLPHEWAFDTTDKLGKFDGDPFRLLVHKTDTRTRLILPGSIVPGSWLGDNRILNNGKSNFYELQEGPEPISEWWRKVKDPEKMGMVLTVKYISPNHYPPNYAEEFWGDDVKIIGEPDR